MADPTEAQLKEAARKALAAGDTAAAKRLVDAARKVGAMQPTPAPGQSQAMATGLSQLSDMTQNPKIDVEGQIKGLTVQAQQAYGAGNDAEGRRLLTEASRLSVDSGMAPEGFTADPRTGSMIDLRNDPTLAMSGGKSSMFGAMQGLGYNFGDEAIGGMASLVEALGGGGGMDRRFATESAREMDRRAQENPWAYYAGYLPGAVASSLSLGKATGLATPSTTVPGIMTKGALLGGMEGGLSGAGAAEGGLGDRAKSAAWGAGIGAGIGGALAPLVGAGVNKLLQWNANRRAIAAATSGAPTTAELRAAGNAAYQAVDDAGVVVKPEAFAGMVDDVTGRMRAAGLDEGMGSLTPQSARVAAILEDAATNPKTTGIPFREIDLLRRKAGVPGANMAVPLESRLGTTAIEGVDDFVRNLTPDQVSAGDAQSLPALIGKARDIWSKMSKSQLIDDAMEASGNYLSGSASGIRNQFARILKSDKLSRGFSEVEKAAMRRVVNGSIPEKVLNLFSGGIGQTAAATTGAYMGNLPGLALGLGIGSAARKGSEALAGRNAEIVRALVAAGGTGNLPVISQTPRTVVEALIRRGGGLAAQ